MERQFSERQLIRWAVPGWLTLFLMILLISVHLLLDRDFDSCAWRFLIEDGATFAALGAAVIASGFALGFMLFQIYFVLYWCDWKFWKFPPVHTLVGRAVDYKEVVDSLDRFKPTLNKKFGHWPVDSDSTGTERQGNEASVVAAWWRGISHKREQRMVWEDRNQYLVSVYHSLGATLVGTYLTLIFLILYILTVILLDLWHGGWAAPIVAFIILIVWIFVLRKGRKNTEFSHRNLTKHALYYFYQQDNEKDMDKQIQKESS